ncbi:MAG: hypothetical protein KDA28_15845, partial [Phycisphaerales bacterium]|nr:hypothetical protein [Phycisphaerales bacterium]
DGGAKVSSDAVQVNLELARPSSPTNVEAVPGETVINVTWDEVSGNQGYQVYVSSTELTSGSEPEDVGASSTASADESVNVSSGVSVGGTYWVGVTTVNSFGNESVLSVFGPVVTQPTDDFWELYKENGGTEIGGYCAVSRQTDARGLFGMFGVLALLGLRRRRTPRRIVGGCILMGALVLGVPASAQVQNELESPISSALEIKLGNYEPQIDEGSGGGDAFATVFGDANLGFELEYDYQVWRGIGSLGIGLNLGYVSATGSSVNEDGTSSPDRSRLNMFPLRAALVYRLDWFQTQYRIPLVLAFKFGLDYYLWSTRSSGGVSDYTDASGERTIGRGATHGYHAAIGGYFLLDSLAPRMAQAFDANSGVNNSYIFAEYLIANIDDFGSSDSWDLGDRTAMFGLAFEF